MPSRICCAAAIASSSCCCAAAWVYRAGIRRGGITKAGNTHVRRLLIEASWHYRHPPRLGAALKQRRAGQPATVIAIADKAQQRLYRRQRHLAAHGKSPTTAVVAAARELSGFIWAALSHPPQQPDHTI
jgi:transposase